MRRVGVLAFEGSEGFHQFTGRTIIRVANASHEFEKSED
jgi:hypothetical protein